MPMIPVKVHPHARSEKVEKLESGGYEVWTTAAPDKGAANAAVAKLLARALDVPPSRVVLRRGATSRNKLFEILQ